MIAVKILGSGADCQRLEEAVRTAVHDSALNASVEMVTDPREFARYGVMRTPAVVVDGRVVVSGRVPGSAELQALLAVAPAP
jgi:small redox-active disulfide protein 2